MAVGIAGSTLCSELNRLANGGTYPALTAYLDSQGAANKWAGITNGNLSTVGALNIKAGVTDRKLFKDLVGICNTLAGTTNKSAGDALRGISS